MKSKNEYYYIPAEDIPISGTVNNVVINSNYVHLIPENEGDAVTGFNCEVAEDHASVLTAENDGLVNLTLKHLDAGSSAGNQLYLGGSDIVLAPQQYAFFRKVGKGYILSGIV
jgi:hypothetical protein